MKKFIVAGCVLMAMGGSADAQNWAPNYNYIQTPRPERSRPSDKEPYIEWAENPKVHPVPPEYADQPAIYLNYEVSVDYRYEGTGVNVFTSTHRLAKVLDESGMQSFNRIRIPVGYGTRVPLVKARTITPSGKVFDIRKDMIKVTKNESGYYTIVIAMEGVEKNSEIEILTKTISSTDFYGHHFFQAGIPIANARFDLSYPKDMIFEMRSHNGFPELKDKETSSRKRYVVQLTDVKPIKDEPHSFPMLHLMSVEYKLKNFAKNTERARINTWDDYARKMWDNNYKYSEKEKASVNKFLSDLGVKPNGNEIDNIKKIEKGIKTQISLYEVVDYEERKEVLASRNFRSVSLYSADWDAKKDVLDSIITKRSASPSGYVKLFAACLTQAGVRHELGTTGDRSEYTLNKNFENWEAMGHPVFYFPNAKKFIAPLSLYLRYPVIPAELTGGKGVFCNITPANGVPGSLFQFRNIPALSAKETQNNINANVSFTKDMSADVAVSYAMTGYAPVSLRQSLAFNTAKDKEKDIVRSMIPFLDKPEDLKNYTISNENFNTYNGNKPLEIYASVNTPALTEKAGKNYLFKVGDLIGRQDELYSEKDRTMPVDLLYPNSFNRTITINIPKGYKIMNLDALRMSSDYVNGDLDPVASFKSDYTIVKDKQKGDKLIITVNEFYTQLHYDIYEYDRYRKVVNTAADFNKVSLLLGKKPV
jgi:hypothetical protein